MNDSNESPNPAFAQATGSANGYDPVECLRKEVARFKATNSFSPLLVTGFYAQAACVLHEIDEAREELAALRSVRERQAATIRKLERDIIELEEAALSPNHKDYPTNVGYPSPAHENRQDERGAK